MSALNDRMQDMMRGIESEMDDLKSYKIKFAQSNSIPKHSIESYMNVFDSLTKMYTFIKENQAIVKERIALNQRA